MLPIILRRCYTDSIARSSLVLWDNSVMERFFLNLKMERVWRRRYANYDEASRDVANYIVGFYNCERLHSTLGYMSPNTFEAKMTVEQPNSVCEKS